MAEEHRDEFRAVAQYLNDLAEQDLERGISVWLVAAKAVRIDDSRWAPLFQAVVEPNAFTTTVEQAKQSEARLRSLDEFWATFSSSPLLDAAQRVFNAWKDGPSRTRLGPDHLVLEASGPSVAGVRTVVAIYSDGKVMVPFGSYAGQNSGIPIPSLVEDDFRSAADQLFGFNGSERLARTKPGWLTTATADDLIKFCLSVADAYAEAMLSESSSSTSSSSSSS